MIRHPRVVGCGPQRGRRLWGADTAGMLGWGVHTTGLGGGDNTPQSQASISFRVIRQLAQGPSVCHVPAVQRSDEVRSVLQVRKPSEPDEQLSAGSEKLVSQ